MTMHCEITGIEELIRETEMTLDAVVWAEASLGAIDVANEAKSVHRYTNRTYLLESRTTTGRVDGLFMRGTLRVQILGNTKYGGYLEDGTSAIEAKRGDAKWFAFLWPAWLVKQNDFADRIAEGIVRGFTLAGWGVS